MIIKEDCAFYKEEQKDCSILLELYCRNCKRCAFYKTKEQENKDRRKYGYKLMEG